LSTAQSMIPATQHIRLITEEVALKNKFGAEIEKYQEITDKIKKLHLNCILDTSKLQNTLEQQKIQKHIDNLIHDIITIFDNDLTKNLTITRDRISHGINFLYQTFQISEANEEKIQKIKSINEKLEKIYNTYNKNKSAKISDITNPIEVQSEQIVPTIENLINPTPLINEDT